MGKGTNDGAMNAKGYNLKPEKNYENEQRRK